MDEDTEDNVCKDDEKSDWEYADELITESEMVVGVEGMYGVEETEVDDCRASDDLEALTDNEIEALINKYPSDLELGGTWWDQQR